MAEVSCSEWFGVKWLIVEKLTDSDFFIVDVTGTSGHHIYNTDIVILFTINVDGGIIVVNLKFSLWITMPYKTLYISLHHKWILKGTL